jgi:hypothetical protein
MNVDSPIQKRNTMSMLNMSFFPVTAANIQYAGLEKKHNVHVKKECR